MDIINKRRSVRKYLNTPVESEKIEQILRAAMQAPSARNQQPWRFLVIQDSTTLKEIANVSPNIKMLLEAPCAIVVLTSTENLTAPLMAAQDASAATMNIMLKATELDLGTCWCGVYPHTERMDIITKLLNVPDNLLVFSVIAIGYPSDPNALNFVDRFDPNKVYYEHF